MQTETISPTVNHSNHLSPSSVFDQVKRQDENTNAKEFRLAQTLSLMSDWRANKKSRSEAIPMEIWHQLRALRGHYSDKQLSSLFEIPRVTIEEKCRVETQVALAQQEVVAVSKEQPTSPSLMLCEARLPAQVNGSAADKIYTPQKLEQKKTVVVELTRSDGMIMKLYATTESIGEIFQTFFKG